MNTTVSTEWDFPTSQDEAALLSEFELALKSGGVSLKNQFKLRFHEFGGIQGRADMVDAIVRALPERVDLDDFADSLISPSKALILSRLRYGAPRSQSYLLRMTGIAPQQFRRYINELTRAELIQVHESSAVSLACRLPWHMVDIVSYEAKLKDWRRALHQAIGYRAFSHSVRVVMPVAGARRAEQLVDTFRTNGIGLIAVDDGATHVVIRSRKRRPASRKLYLMAVGAIVREFVNDRRRLHRKLRPETIERL